MNNKRGKYCMTISRMTIDKLGVKLYDKVSAVIAELIANAYDADAEEVTVKAPMGSMLASLSQGKVSDSGYEITVQDTGHGMKSDEINPFYLTIGSERRNDPKRGNKTPKFQRKVMGRKGVGKLAPFGICETLEVISSSGEKIFAKDKDGNQIQGYKTAHFIMRRSEILTDEDSSYEPEVGPLDDTLQTATGTKIIMRNFSRRQVPEMETFLRQLAQRFGVVRNDWRIHLVDTKLTENIEGQTRIVDCFKVDTMLNTKIILRAPTTEVVDSDRINEFLAENEKGHIEPNLTAGFTSENGNFYPVKGWVAYAKNPYRDDLMAGIRIYCRGKIAAQTAVFNHKSGFTGEHSIRSYLVGELHVDWLDEKDDLIQTDRRDILWSDELGCEFEKWGQKLVSLIGKLSREPEKKKVWEEFLETSNLYKKVNKIYPGEKWKEIREKTIELARILGERLRPAEVQDSEYVNSLVQYSLTFGPHVILDNALRDAANEKQTAIEAMVTIFRTAKIAELSSYGIIAEKRVKVVQRIIELNDSTDTLEQYLQESIAEAPWLLNPFWSPITANQTLSTFKKNFEKFYNDRTKDKEEKISLQRLNSNNRSIRPDFILSNDDYGLQIVEIKKPEHTLQNKEWDRIQSYIDEMTEFLKIKGNEDFQKIFKGFTVTLICDNVEKLSGAQARAFETYKNDRTLEHITWKSFLFRTEKIHQEFLNEAQRQKDLEIQKS